MKACGCVSIGFASVGPNQAFEYFLPTAYTAKTLKIL